MSTDYQQARVALGARLRELRLSSPGGRLTGTQLASRLGWAQSKVSKLELGQQTAAPEDLAQWAVATGQPDIEGELLARLRGFESHIRSWRRQLASGHRPVQDTWYAESARTTVTRVWESAMIPGVLQTADYARAVFTRYAQLMQSERDTEEAVRGRLRRQEFLYDPGKRFEVLVSEAALRSVICPPSVLAAQLDRLAGLIGLDTVKLMIVPLSAPLKIPPANGFWILDDRLAITEDWHAELWLDDAESIALYQRVWDTLRESAVHGPEAHRVISRARRSLDPPQSLAGSD
ncbi:transcriptional regulator [Streptomyces lunaelactis]|uniref:Transcriptional regulator n=1 Tax=Streptomyces lunaelactis TaxID=1535768 RepID=A0A2R4T3I6_9ACTN|nr:helix-turn-helix transcriptional regulator [Streptomyces lunaelactis]AVZ73671.1 transcriptional regulator [Streptomyces lunaelactis]NUK84450.1 helix-turn-helix domain-containing protein [Streptomyces lunaelactis]NUL03159.1 helix-turn-helix domain-containing protein [Streptomyces lunaelactis]